MTNINCLDFAFQDFSTNLFDRFSKGIFTSEDNVRYYFVDSIKKELFLSNLDVILEQKYNNSSIRKYRNVINLGSNLEMDAQFNIGSDYSIFSEIKYHPNGKSSLTTTENAGELINDLIRLSSIKNKGRKLLIYVFESEMHNYFSGNSSVVNFLAPSIIINNDTIDRLTDTATTKALANITVNVLNFELKAELIFHDSSNNTFIKIYEITSVKGDSYNEK